MDSRHAHPFLRHLTPVNRPVPGKIYVCLFCFYITMLAWSILLKIKV